MFAAEPSQPHARLLAYSSVKLRLEAWKGQLARPARPELLRDNVCEPVLYAADGPADEESDDRDPHGEHLDAGQKRQTKGAWAKAIRDKA